jgi:prephenate dehydrogenase
MNAPIRTPAPFSQVAIIGVGVIGGSLGLTIKTHFPSVTVVGFDRRDVLKKACKKGAIDRAAVSLRSAVEKADLVFLAMPVLEILKALPRIAKYSPADVLISDVGSVKGSIMLSARRLFPRGNFIGGHPMAGVELSGIEAAHPLLFENAVYVLTPTRRKANSAVKRLASFLEQLGARVVVLDSQTHDEVASVVSHLPQLTAVALTNVAGGRHVSGRRHLRLAAGGFRDLTRIASSKPEIWADILTQNKIEIDKSLKLMIRELNHYRRLLSRSKTFPLGEEFNSARRIRNNIPKTMKGFIRQLDELYVFVKDQPGMVAKMTSSLAKARINIKDIELMKVREGRGGTFRLAFESKEMSTRAAHVLSRAGFEIGA